MVFLIFPNIPFMKNPWTKFLESLNPSKKVCRKIIPSSDSEENIVKEDEDVAEVISIGTLTQRIPPNIVFQSLSIPLERGKKIYAIYQCY